MAMNTLRNFPGHMSLLFMPGSLASGLRNGTRGRFHFGVSCFKLVRGPRREGDIHGLTNGLLLDRQKIFQSWGRTRESDPNDKKYWPGGPALRKCVRFRFLH